MNTFTGVTGRVPGRFIAALLISCTAFGGCNGSRTAVLRVDHETGDATLIQPGSERERSLEPWATARVRADEVVVEVVHSATPFYTYGVNVEPTDSPDVAALHSFLKPLGFYFTDIPGLFDTHQLDPFDVEFLGLDVQEDSLAALPVSPETQAQQVKGSLAKLERILFVGEVAEQGRPSLQEVQLRTLSALRVMGESYRNSPTDADLRVAADALDENLGAVFSGGDGTAEAPEVRHLVLRDDLVRVYDDLFSKTLSLRRMVIDKLNPTQFGPVSGTSSEATADNPVAEGAVVADSVAVPAEILQTLRRADEALSKAPTVLSGARQVEQLAIRAMEAETTWADTVEVPWDKGRSVVVTVSPEKEAALGSYATEEPLTYKVTLVQDWFLRPSVGLTFAYVPDGRFASYTVEESDGGTMVLEDGEEDERFNFLLTLGLIPSVLASESVAAALEFHIGPSTDVRALGTGASLGYTIRSFGTLKLQGGALWIRHEVAEDTRVRETYGKPRGFVGFSISGWPPFLPG